VTVTTGAFARINLQAKFCQRQLQQTQQPARE
jgi:hypothetical protein